MRHSGLERELRREIRAAFPGITIECRRDGEGYCGRLDLPSGSWCSTVGETRTQCLRNCLALAREPAPGFPGWAEPSSPLAEVDDVEDDEVGSP